MYKHFIFNHEIEEPDGFDGTLFSKGVSDVYHGFMGNGMGVNLANHNLSISISEAEIVKTISRVIKDDGYNAKIPYRVEYCDKIVFDGFIDVSSYAESCCDCRFSVIQTTNDNFIANRNTKYGIVPSTYVYFEGKRIFTQTTFILNSDLGSYTNANISSGDYKHYVPVKIDKNQLATLTANNILGFTIKTPILINNSGNVTGAKINGAIDLTANTVMVTDFNLVISVENANNELISKTIIGTKNANGSGVLHFTVNWEKNISPGEKVYLFIENVVGTVIATECNFGYSMASLTVSDTDYTVLQGTTIKGILLKDVFSNLFTKMGITASIKSDWLQSEKANFIITNGYNLRGVNKSVNIIFESFFKNLTKILCIGANYDTNVFNIESLLDLNSCKNTMYLGSLDSINVNNAQNEIGVNLKMNTDHYYSSIDVGYSKWQSSLLFSTDEYNASHTYSTSNLANAQALDLKSELIASSYLIEELRTLPLLEDKNKNKSHAEDESLFIIAVLKNGNGYIAESSQNFMNISGILSPQHTYNLRITPKRNLLRWLEYYGNNNKLTLTAYEGNNNLVSEDVNFGIVNEGAGVDKVSNGLFSNYLSEITIDGSPEVFNDIGNCINFEVCGEEKVGIIKNIEFKPDVTGGKFRIETMNLN